MVEARGRPIGEWLLLGLSVAGAPLVRWVLHRLGARGGYVVISGCSVLLARDAVMVAGGAPRRLLLVPRLLLFLELAANGIAVSSGCRAWVGKAPARDHSRAGQVDIRGHRTSQSPTTGAARVRPLNWPRVSIVAAELALALHAVRMAIYVLSPDRGRRRLVIDQEGASPLATTR